MHGILSLILLLPLGAKTDAESKPISAAKGGDRSAGKPSWARDMPPEGTIGFVKELQRRMAEGPIVRVQTAVQGFVPVALSSLNKDLSPGVHVSGTSVEVVSPVKYKGLELLIHHQTSPSAQSCWRTPGCRVEFDFYERQLEAKQAKLQGLPFIYDRGLKNVALGEPSVEKGTTPSVDKGTRP